MDTGLDHTPTSRAEIRRNIGMRLSHGTKLWVGLVFYVVAVDSHAAISGRETLSSAWWGACKHPKHRWYVIPVWLYLSAHLHKLIPSEWDPLRRLG